ncbi:unnamed protein product [Phytophthora fragariaefolia]|uniref:Unnamed protein product n=1 Tax=Phytophthora fragariaefolia TaxID=1490495 RepID=A0A9W6YCB7_9STRA|nr:unnamed protein product [Phytophthora fragariaefolia]
MLNVEDSLSGEAETNGTVDATVTNTTASLETVSTSTEAKEQATKSKPAPNHRTRSKGGRQNGKMHRKPAKRFEQFQRHEALGQFSVLADTDSDEGDSDDMDVDDEAARYESPTSCIGEDDAPYAFPATEDASMVVDVGPKAAPAHAVDAPMTTAEPMEGVKTETRQHTGTRLKKGKRGGALKGMQTSMANYMHHASATVAYAKTDEEATPAGTEASTERDVIIPDTPDSQEDFTIEDTRSGNDAGDNDLPIQIGQWLQSFQGSEVGVVANGHCAFLAMHATSANYSGADMKNTVEVVAETTELKWFVYALMMNNLRKDVQLNLIDPIKACASLHPDQPPFTSVQGATAALYAHYDAARKRSAGAKVQSHAHVQKYCYGTHRLADGTDHESGYGAALKDRDATEYLRNCWRLHVLPTFIILRHHERHFYGVRHGELYFKWRAEGDPGFTPDIAADYDWKTYINVLTDQEREVDMATINRLADRDDVNDIIIKRLDMRVRLDVVHARGVSQYWTRMRLKRTGQCCQKRRSKPYTKIMVSIITQQDFYLLAQMMSAAQDFPRVQDTQTKAKVKTFCKERLVAVEDKNVNMETAYMLARAPDRWKRLAQWLPPRYCRAQPQPLMEQVWRILHVIPYTVAAWTDTPMGRAHTGARATWYDTFPFVRSLCHGVVDHNDWSSATEAPTGQAWGETAEEFSAGLPTPERN